MLNAKSKDEHIKSYIDKLVPVGKSIYDYVEYDSDMEREIAGALDERGEIKLFIKLPGWFKVETPVGTYNPDWAIVPECDNKLYLVRESKGTKDKDDLRSKEWSKILCGKAHFDELRVWDKRMNAWYIPISKNKLSFAEQIFP